MRLTKISIQNFRSIRNSGDIAVEPLQALVGENNCGKSNILRAIQCFLSPGAGGMLPSDFNEADSPAVIECEFSGLSDDEKKHLRRYLLGDKVILRKELTIFEDNARDKTTVKAEYHGYQAEPKHAFLSAPKLEAASSGGRVNWKAIAESHGILEYVQSADGRVTKATYVAGINRFLTENDVEYDEPVLGETQALGIPQNLLAALPEFYLLPAITDYSDEVDRRSSTSVFRRLMANLSDRIMKADPRFNELEAALKQVRDLLNCVNANAGPMRLTSIAGVENSLRDVLKKLMPSVNSVNLGVEVDTSKDIFAKGVSIKIDDGVVTDVIDKGHGMQRSLVFSLLQMLIKAGAPDGNRPILLAIEEPELYIHPHCQRLIFRVLREFAGLDADDNEPTGSDQVIYATHSPAFVEVWNYERIGVVRKPSLPVGTIVRQAPKGILGTSTDRKTFKMLTSFGLKHNEVFFARDAIIVEGPEDEIGIIATARKLGRIEELPDEVGVSVIVTNGKGDIPKFQTILNAFTFGYGVLLELDGHGEDHSQTAPIIEALNGNRVAKVPNRLEDALGIGRHFDDQRHAKQFFSDPNNINGAMETIVQTLLPPA